MSLEIFSKQILSFWKSIQFTTNYANNQNSSIFSSDLFLRLKIEERQGIKIESSSNSTTVQNY